MMAILALTAVFVGVVITLTSKTPYATAATLLAVAMALDAVLPIAVRVSLMLGVAALSALALLHFSRHRHRASTAQKTSVLATVTVCMWWTLEVANPNVLSLADGLDGLRKSLMLFLGFWIGIRWAAQAGASTVVRLVTRLIASTLALALVIHRFAPQVEQGVIRSADMATATIFGDYRLAGLFAGPFHIGLAAATVLSLAVVSHLTSAAPWWANCLVGSIAVAALLASEVRTAYVAAVVAVTVAIISSLDLRTRPLRVATAVAFVTMTGVFAARNSASVSSILDAGTDTRLLNRLLVYDTGVKLVVSRKWFGYGTGSASDTGDPSGFGVTIVSHNVLLKFAFEGGLVGLALFVIAATCLWRASRVDDRFLRGSAVASLAAMATMGATGSMVEALPVTLWLLMIVGAVSTETGRVPSADTDATVSRLREGRARERPDARRPSPRRTRGRCSRLIPVRPEPSSLNG